MRSFHPLKRSDNYVDLCRVPAKSRDHFDALQRCSLAELYLKSDLSVILELGMLPERLPVVVGSREHDIVARCAPVFVLQLHAGYSNDGQHGNQQDMFIVNVEIVEGEDIVVPSLVRFHTIDHEREERGRYVFSLQSGFKVFPRFLGVDRKLTVSGDLREHGAPCNIKSAVEIMNCVTNQQGDIGAERAVSKSVIEELFPRLDIHVQTGAVCVGRDTKSLLDISDVLVGPFDF